MFVFSSRPALVRSFFVIFLASHLAVVSPNFNIYVVGYRTRSILRSILLGENPSPQNQEVPGPEPVIDIVFVLVFLWNASRRMKASSNTLRFSVQI